MPACAVGRGGRLDRRRVPVDAFVFLSLPAVGGHELMKVALWIHESDTDKGQPQVARFLADVAGKDTQTAGVDRQRLMQGELR